MIPRGFSIQEVSKAIKGKVVTWDNDKIIKSFSNRMKNVSKDSLYIIYKGWRNEEVLINKLKNRNAAGIVVSRSKKLNIEKWSKAGLGVIRVLAPNSAYYDMARLYRKQIDIPIIQITGSSGKTTTKEMIGAILRHNMPTLVGYGNINLTSGIIEQITGIKNSHKAIVFEAGMKARGQMRETSSITRPYIGVVTCINRSHYARMGSIDKIIEAKAEMLEYLSEDGYLIINGSDKNCSRYPVKRFKGKVLTFGFSQKCDIWASDIKSENFTTTFKAHFNKRTIDCTINTVGKYNVSNALAAIMVGLKMGIAPKDIVKGLRNFKPFSSRMEVRRGIKDTIIINDNFNANPDSTRMLLNEIPGFAEGRPVVLVMGDMENPTDKISNYARKVHYEIGQQIGRLNPKYLFAIGKWAKEYLNGAVEQGMDRSKIYYFKTIEDAKKALVNNIVRGSIIIFKASATYVDLRKLIPLLRK